MLKTLRTDLEIELEIDDQIYLFTECREGEIDGTVDYALPLDQVCEALEIDQKQLIARVIELLRLSPGVLTLDAPIDYVPLDLFLKVLDNKNTLIGD